MKRLMSMLATAALACAAAVAVLLTVADLGRPTEAASPLTAPSVTGVQPATAPNDLDATIIITGTGFAAVPTVTLGSTQLDDVGWVSAERLTATVPWGLITGTHTLNVVNPNGESGSLADAFTVTQGIGVWATGGPYGGRVQQIVVNPVTPTTAYAAVFAVGTFATFDGGDHWQPMLIDPYPIRLALDAQDPAIMYLSGSRFY
jgi:hypothetical protein